MQSRKHWSGTGRGTHMTLELKRLDSGKAMLTIDSKTTICDSVADAIAEVVKWEKEQHMILDVR